MDGIDERRVEIERELKTRENDIGEAKQLKFSISDEAGTVESDLKSYAEKLHEAESRVMELRDQVSDRR